MLILVRRAGESIHIGADIVVTLVSVDRNRARIGIDAPRNIPVDREEIALRKQEQTLTDLDGNKEEDDIGAQVPVRGRQARR